MPTKTSQADESPLAEAPAGASKAEVSVADFTAQLEPWKTRALCVRFGLRLADERPVAELKQLLNEALHGGI